MSRIVASRRRFGWCGGALAQNKIKYALGDVIGIDDLPLLVAAERSKKRGVEVEITPFKNEDIATQAVINGQADIGQGTPYAAIEKVNVPIRFFVQLWSLQFSRWWRTSTTRAGRTSTARRSPCRAAARAPRRSCCSWRSSMASSTRT